MDDFGGLLDGPRARGAFALRTVMSPPWSLRVLAESPLTLLAMVKGEAWVVPDLGDPVRLGVGDIAVTRGPDHYTVTSDPASPISVVIHPGQHCCSPDGESMEGHLRFSEPLPVPFLGRPRVVSMLFGPDLLHLVLVDPQSGVVPLPATWQENRLDSHVEVPGLDFSLEAVKAGSH